MEIRRKGFVVSDGRTDNDCMSAAKDNKIFSWAWEFKVYLHHAVKQLEDWV
jgi:hypothetical protein